MKKALNIYIDFDIVAKADRIAKAEEISRTQAIEEAIELWIKKKENEKLAVEFSKASEAVRDESRDVTKDWDDTISDGLE